MILLGVSMRLSFDDKESESFRVMEAAGSLRFNNPQSASESNTHQQVGTQEMSEGIDFNNPSNDSDLNTLQQMGRSTY